MPNGITAPGNVSPPLVVPIRGLTASAGDTALCAHALPTIASETLAHRSRDFIDTVERDIGDITGSSKGGMPTPLARHGPWPGSSQKPQRFSVAIRQSPTRLIQDN